MRRMGEQAQLFWVLFKMNSHPTHCNVVIKILIIKVLTSYQPTIFLSPKNVTVAWTISPNLLECTISFKRLSFKLCESCHLPSKLSKLINGMQQFYVSRHVDWLLHLACKFVSWPIDIDQHSPTFFFFNFFFFSFHFASNVLKLIYYQTLNPYPPKTVEFWSNSDENASLVWVGQL